MSLPPLVHTRVCRNSLTSMYPNDVSTNMHACWRDGVYMVIPPTASKHVIGTDWWWGSHDTGISPSLAKRCVVAELEGHGLWDMRRPLPFHGADPLPIRLLTFDDPQGKSVFWHSSAHFLGYAVELLYGPEGALLLDGPATAEGFFYDAVMGAGISEMEVTQLRGLVQRIVEARLPFQRLEVSREVASEMVASHNPYKEQLLNKIPNDGTPITVSPHSPCPFTCLPLFVCVCLLSLLLSCMFVCARVHNTPFSLVPFTVVFSCIFSPSPSLSLCVCVFHCFVCA